MGDESTPYLRAVAEEVRRAAEIQVQVLAQLKSQAQAMQDGLDLVAKSVADQTQALGSLEVETRLAEMVALKGLIAAEGEFIREETERDAAAMREMLAFFAKSAQEIADLRNKRVRDLLAPLYRLMDDDLAENVERRIEAVPGLVEEYVDVAGETMARRDGALSAAIDEVHAAAASLAAERQAVRRTIAGLQVPAAELPVEGEGQVLGIPFYVVMVEGAGPKVVGPSTALESRQQALGTVLQPVEGLERPRERLEAMAGDLAGLAAGGRAERWAGDGLAEEVPRHPGLWGRALRLVARALRASTFTTWDMRGSGPSLAAAEREHLGRPEAPASRAEPA